MATQAASIIPVFTGTIGHDTAQLVDARTLHRFLEVGKVFGAWIQERIKQYGFEENHDYLIAFQNEKTNSAPRNEGAEGIFQNGKKPRGGRPRTEYHLTLDMAKELSMVERNEKGKQARRYFIECEKQLHAVAPEVAHRIADETIGTDGLKVLRELIGKKVRVLPTSARSSAQHRLWNLLHTRFNVPKAEMIAANDMDAAANFVGQWAIEGEYLERARPAPAATATVDFPRRQKAADFTPESLYGPEAWNSDLSTMMAELRRAAQSGTLLRVENIDGAMEEMLALRHLGEISHKAPAIREPETRKSQTLYYSLIALEHFLEVLAGKSPAGQEISAEQRQHYQQRAERCVAECIALAQDPGRLAESGEVATILRNVEALSGRANALERDFVERVGPALKLLDSRLYGNWREHIGVLARYLNMNGKRSPVHALSSQ
ncbi:antA/AntB antirepressor family protein [Salinicola sp. JS01]|nr:antA/AntB antirepressor family protein [Salinicola sp. JS01]WIX32501.1 antA/AntB antirepressor family protein [Salinicola sp. JS01]